MSLEQIMLAAMAAAIVVAVVALVVALIALRRLRPLALPDRAPESISSVPSAHQSVPLSTPERAPQREEGRAVAVAHVIEGRVVVTPTSRQVVEATMGRPLVRASVVLSGLAHALRPESRDRIRALMRREYNHRRNQRRRVARQAARTHATTSTPLQRPPDRREIAS